MKIISLKPDPARANKIVEESGEGMIVYVLSVGLAAALLQSGRWSAEECEKMAGDLATEAIEKRMEFAEKGGVNMLVEIDGGGYVGIASATSMVSPLFSNKGQAKDWLAITESILMMLAKTAVKIEMGK